MFMKRKCKIILNPTYYNEKNNGYNKIFSLKNNIKIEIADNCACLEFSFDNRTKVDNIYNLKNDLVSYFFIKPIYYMFL